MLINNFNNWGYQSLYQPKNSQPNKEKDKIKDPVLRSFDFNEEKEKRLSSSIEAKMTAGKKLTAEEEMYLRRTDPVMYAKYMMLQKKKELLKRKLENCKSKKEVNDTINMELSSIGRKDPDREMKINAIKDVEKEFKKTMKYQKLPANVDEKDEKRQKKRKSSDT